MVFFVRKKTADRAPVKKALYPAGKVRKDLPKITVSMTPAGKINYDSQFLVKPTRHRLSYKEAKAVVREAIIDILKKKPGLNIYREIDAEIDTALSGSTVSFLTNPFGVIKIKIYPGLFAEYSGSIEDYFNRGEAIKSLKEMWLEPYLEEALRQKKRVSKFELDRIKTKESEYDWFVKKIESLYKKKEYDTCIRLIDQLLADRNEIRMRKITDWTLNFHKTECLVEKKKFRKALKMCEELLWEADSEQNMPKPAGDMLIDIAEETKDGKIIQKEVGVIPQHTKEKRGEKSAGKSQVYYLVGKINLLKKKYEEAENNFRIASGFAESPEKKAALIYNRAIAQVKIKKYAGALFSLDESLKLKPGQIYAMLLLTDVMIQLKKYGECIKYGEELLKKIDNKKHKAVLLNNIAVSYYILDKDSSKARDLLLDGLGLNRKNRVIIENIKKLQRVRKTGKKVHLQTVFIFKQ